jgi:hypothetical protein
MALAFFAFAAPMPVPLVGALASLFGYLGIRAARRHPILFIEKWLAWVGMWAGIVNVLFIAGLVIFTSDRRAVFSSFG